MEYHRIDHLNYMLKHIDPVQLLTELTKALSNSENEENFDFICRMHDIKYYREHLEVKNAKEKESQAY